MLTAIVSIILIALLIYDDYLDERGRHKYHVIVGIKGEGIDSWEEYDVYANRDYLAEDKAKRLYIKDNEMPYDYEELECLITERID